MRRFLLTALVCSISVSAICQPNRFNTVKDLTDSIQLIMKEGHITGLMLGICSKDSILFSGGFGYARVETGRKVDSTTLFRLGSITKMFVSLAILKLIQEGKLDLNSELKKIAPEVPFQNPWEETNPVRLVHLLEHTSGFDDMKLNRMYSEDPVSNDGKSMMLVQSKSMKCRWKPGERFAYSNPNYSILGWIIEKISGQRFDEYIAQNILLPLGMTKTNFNLWSKFPEHDVGEYIIRGGKPIQVKSVVCLSGAPGALWSSSDDMLKFIRSFLRKGAPLFDAATIDSMEIPHSSLAARGGQKTGYALGNEKSGFLFARVPLQGHGGLMGTCYSGLRYSRAVDFGFVVATNSNQPTARIENLIVSFFEKDSQAKIPVSESLSLEKIREFEGVYQFESPRNAISGFVDKLQFVEKIYLHNGKFWIKHIYGQPHELIQTGEMIFTIKGMNSPFVRLTKNDEGRKVLLIGGTYYEQTSPFWAHAYRIGVLSAIGICLISIIVFLISVVNAFRKKISWKETGLRLVPVIGIAGLLIASMQLLKVKTQSYLLYQFNSVNALTLSVFLGTSLFGLATIIVAFNAVRNFRSYRNRWYVFFNILLAVSLLYLSLILGSNGWISLRVWAE